MDELSKAIENHFQACGHVVTEDMDYAVVTPLVERRLWYCEHCTFHVSTAEFVDGKFHVSTAL